MNNNGWKPVEDNTPNLFNQMLADYVSRGAPIDHGAAGWAGLGYVILVVLLIIGFIVGVYILFMIAIDAYPLVESASGVWVNGTPMP